jgi:hypothetical protein
MREFYPSWLAGAVAPALARQIVVLSWRGRQDVQECTVQAAIQAALAEREKRSHLREHASRVSAIAG